MNHPRWTVRVAFFILILAAVHCAGAKKPALDPESREFLEYARLIMSKEETYIFSHLPDQASRQEYMRELWEKRDTDLSTEENEFKEEFYRRIDYANQHFREGIPGWKTQRGRIYIYLGPPDDIDDYPMLSQPEARGVIIWVYANRLAITFVDEQGDGRYSFDPSTGARGDLFRALERAKFGLSVSKSSEKFVDFDIRYDRESKQLFLAVPISSLMFRAKENMLSADFEFTFHLFNRKTLRREKLQERRPFEKGEEEVKGLKTVDFVFPLSAESGSYILDIILVIRPGEIKTRKIIEIKI